MCSDINSFLCVGQSHVDNSRSNPPFEEITLAEPIPVLYVTARGDRTPMQNSNVPQATPTRNQLCIMVRHAFT